MLDHDRISLLEHAVIVVDRVVPRVPQGAVEEHLSRRFAPAANPSPSPSATRCWAGYSTYSARCATRVRISHVITV